MALFFRDRQPNRIHGQSARFYDAVANDGSVRLQDFKLVLKNPIEQGNEGDPVSAGNLNFASGNAEFPVAPAQAVTRGQLVTLTPVGVAPVNIARPLAATGTQTELQTVLRFSNTKILLVYRNGGTFSNGNTAGFVVVADIDWGNRSISMGAQHSVSNTTAVEVINSTTFCCLVYGAATGQPIHNASIIPFIVNGTTITQGVSISVTNGNVAVPRAGMATNPAKMSNSSVLVVHELVGSANYHATQFIVSGNAFVRGAEIANLGAKQGVTLNGLVSINQGQGRFVLYTSTSATAWTARTLGFASMSSLALGSRQYMMPRVYGSLRFGTASYRSVLPQFTANSASMNVFLINVNQSTGALTLGAQQTLPGIYNGNLDAHVTVDTSGRYIFTGPVFQGGAVDMGFFEAAIDGTNLVQTEYWPFRAGGLSPGTVNDGVATARHSGLALENTNNPSEFLFMQHSSLGAVQFSFGVKTDSANSGNIAGIALENAANGRVRVQVSGKLVPGLWNGLRGGAYYNAGNDGNLAVVNAKVHTHRLVGMASSPNDFIFYGADRLV